MRDPLDDQTVDLEEALEDEGHDANGSPTRDWPAMHQRAREWRAMQKAIDAGVD